VAVHEIALADSEGTIALHIFSEDGDGGGGGHANRDVEAGEGRHSIIAPSSDRAGRRIDVALHRLDAFARAHDAEPDVVKIDVEGAECAVVDGMRDLLETRRVRDIFVELHPQLLAEAGRTVEDVEGLITSRGYGIVWSSGRDYEVHRHFRRRDEPPA
jgi:FkbM family methyltransferase